MILCALIYRNALLSLNCGQLPKIPVAAAPEHADIGLDLLSEEKEEDGVRPADLCC